MAKDNLFASLPDDLPGSNEQENSADIPEELKGKSPEEIYKRLSEENQKMLEEQEKNLKAQYFDQSQQGQGQQNTQQGTQQGYQPPYSPTPPTSGQYTYNNDDTESPDPYTDPEGFMDLQLNKRLSPLVQNTVQSFRGIAKQNFQSQIGQEEWSKYGQEIESLIDSFSPQVQMNPEVYQTAYRIVQANHLDEITQSKAEQMASEKLQKTLANLGISSEQLKEAMGGEPSNSPQPQAQQPQQSQPQQSSSLFQRNIGVPVTESSRQSTTPYNQNQGGKPKLTDDQKRLAKEFDMTEEEYAEWAQLNTDIISSLGR